MYPVLYVALLLAYVSVVFSLTTSAAKKKFLTVGIAQLVSRLKKRFLQLIS